MAPAPTVLTADRRPIEWTVMADPEGNEFCAFPPSRPGPVS